MSKMTNVLLPVGLLVAVLLVLAVAGVIPGLFPASNEQPDPLQLENAEEAKAPARTVAEDAPGAPVAPPAEKPAQSSGMPAAHVPGQVGLGPVAPLGGLRPFPDSDPWNTPIDNEPVDPASEILIASIGARAPLHPDFGAGVWDGAPIGIPYVIVDGKQPPVRIRYDAYGEESDAGPFPIPPDAPIEGAPNTDGDRHVIVIDRDNKKIYELFRAFRIGGGQFWQADSGAVFDFTANTQRTKGWTSADAAGLPIFPGLVRYEEAVEMGEVRHALRFTVERTRRAYVPPASHFAARSDDPALPPMGMRVRLKKSFDVSSLPKQTKAIAIALQRYGMILADNGSNWFLSGSPDPRWDDDALRSLRQIKGSDFEVVLMRGLVE